MRLMRLEWEQACGRVSAAHDARATSVAAALRAFDGARVSEDIDWILSAVTELAKAVMKAHEVYDEAVEAVMGGVRWESGS